MRTVITGGAGFIGLHLAQRLLDSGAEVVLVDNFQRATRDRDLNRILRHPRCELYEVNLIEDRLPKIDADAIVHLAAIVGVQNVTSRPYEVLRSNVDALTRVLDWATEISSLKNFLFTSTSEIYGGSVRSGLALVPTPEQTPLIIEDPQDPRGTYLLSKIYGEALCGFSGLPHTIVRPHNVYGPRMGMSHVVPELLRKCWAAEPGSSVGVTSVEHTRTFLYIDDATEYLEALLREPGAGQVLNLGSEGPEVSIGTLAELIVETVGKPLTIVPLEPTLGSPPRRAPDTSLIKAATGLRARTSLPEGLTSTYSWYRTHVFEKTGVASV